MSKVGFKYVPTGNHAVHWEKKMEPQETILIVEDEAGPRAALHMILKPLYEIHTTSNGKDALEVIRNLNIDLVTLDLKMPGLSGIDVLKELKKIKPDVEVVIITGEGSLANAHLAIQYGACDFISKPFHVAEVITTIRKSIERKNARLKLKYLIGQTKDSSMIP
jgi:putative two-component system response regulator